MLRDGIDTLGYNGVMDLTHIYGVLHASQISLHFITRFSRKIVNYCAKITNFVFLLNFTHEKNRNVTRAWVDKSEEPLGLLWDFYQTPGVLISHFPLEN